MSDAVGGLAQLRTAWEAQWPRALELWSRYTRLSAPRWCVEAADARREGISGSFAMIRLHDQAVVIDLRLVETLRLQAFALPVLGHEIGHHVYAPANLEDGGRALARMRRALPGIEQQAGLVANLYEDALINDRLHRACGLDMAAIYVALDEARGAAEDAAHESAEDAVHEPAQDAARESAEDEARTAAEGADPNPADRAARKAARRAARKAAGAAASEKARPSPARLWTLYMRIYEILWSLQRGTLAHGDLEAALEGDAHLGARLLRSYAGDWVRGAGRFAALCFPYLLEDQGAAVRERVTPLLDAADAGRGGRAPDGLASCDPGEEEECLHPARDEDADIEPDEGAAPVEASSTPSRDQYREPFEYGQLLRALGLDLSDHEVAVRYYRDRARPHLVPFLTQERPETQEPLPEGLEPWDVGSPLEDVDWLESVMVSPRVVPGVSTRQRTWGTVDGALPKREPLDLDLYVDCSGSMPNPQHQVSYLALAGAIVAMSALRVGARVQATLWSGTGQFESTPGFIRNETEVLRIITGYICGGTAFPIHVLRDTFENRRPDSAPVHILCISDEGIDTMFSRDERGNSGWDVARAALARARGGGTMVLNLWQEADQNATLVRAAREGWNIFRVTQWEELEAFARAFSRAKYGSSPSPRRT